MAAW
jgi:hypothetical protein